MEGVGRLMLERKSGMKVKPVTKVLRHPTQSWMIYHADGIAESPLHPGPGIAEVKVVDYNVLKRFKKEGIREEYIMQPQWGWQ